MWSYYTYNPVELRLFVMYVQNHWAFAARGKPYDLTYPAHEARSLQ